MEKIYLRVNLVLQCVISSVFFCVDGFSHADVVLFHEIFLIVMHPSLFSYSNRVLVTAAMFAMCPSLFSCSNRVLVTPCNSGMIKVCPSLCGGSNLRHPEVSNLTTSRHPPITQLTISLHRCTLPSHSSQDSKDHIFAHLQQR